MVTLRDGKQLHLLIQRKLEEALEFYQAALKIYQEIGNPFGQASALGNIGLLYKEQGRQEEALVQLQQARAILLRVGAQNQLRVAEKAIEQLAAQRSGK